MITRNRPSRSRAPLEFRLPPAAVHLAVRLLPPVLLDVAKLLPFRRVLAGAPEWEYVPDGWLRTTEVGEGWNDASVVETQKRKWPAFLDAASGTGPLAVAHEMPTPTTNDYIAHNTLMSFGYVLALTARRKDSISVLDWGSGVGHYYVLASNLLEGVSMHYHGKDVPALCRAGRELLPQVTFHEDDESSLSRSYDLVFASGSLQYTEDWKSLVAKLARACNAYLYVTRLPTVFKMNSFVVLQRPWHAGYRTEYKGWFLNRDEFVTHAEGLGLNLVREFLVQEKPYVANAPEQCEYRGYLFRPRRSDP